MATGASLDPVLLAPQCRPNMHIIQSEAEVLCRNLGAWGLLGPVS